MSFDPAACRRQAQACMDLSNKATIAEIKTQLAQMAAVWFGLAQNAHEHHLLQQTLDQITPTEDLGTNGKDKDEEETQTLP